MGAAPDLEHDPSGAWQTQSEVAAAVSDTKLLLAVSGTEAAAIALRKERFAGGYLVCRSGIGPEIQADQTVSVARDRFVLLRITTGFKGYYKDPEDDNSRVDTCSQPFWVTLVLTPEGVVSASPEMDRFSDVKIVASGESVSMVGCDPTAGDCPADELTGVPPDCFTALRSGDFGACRLSRAEVRRACARSR